MATRRKVGIALLIILAAAVIVLIIVVPRLANLDRYRPEVIARLEQSTGRSAAIGRISLTVLPEVAVRVDEISIGNPPGFPEQPFLQIRRVYARLGLGALLHREIVIRSLELDDPVLSLVSDSAGHWNTESPPRPQIRPAAWVTDAAPAISIANVKLQNGRVTAASQLPSGVAESPTFEAEAVTAELHDVNAAALGVHLDAEDGRGMERGRADSLSLARVRPAVLVSPAAGPEPRASSLDAVAPPPGALAARGSFGASKVRVNDVQGGPLKSVIEIYGGGVRLSNLSLELSGGRVSGDVVWNSSSRPPSYTTHLALARIHLARLLKAVPNATGKITGTLDGRLSLVGSSVATADPLANKEGTGSVTISNGTLPTIQLNRNLMLLLKSVVNSGQESDDPSSFRSFAADLEISGAEIHSRRITIVGNGVNVDAAGSLALAGAGRLDYTGTSKITARTTGFTGLIASALGAKMAPDGTVNLPFTLTGTLDRPHFVLKNSRFFH
jgi:uncharacterized protein involved in outer membrane biogenesis